MVDEFLGGVQFWGSASSSCSSSPERGDARAGPGEVGVLQSASCVCISWESIFISFLTLVSNSVPLLRHVLLCEHYDELALARLNYASRGVDRLV